MESNGNEWNQLTLFAADTHVSPSASQDNAKEPTTRDTFGHVSPTPFGFFDPDSHCWKTSQATFQWDSEMFKPIWPRSGTTRNGIAYRRQPSAPLTAVTEYSLWLHGRTWSTPTTQEVEHPDMEVNEKGRRASKSGHGRGHSIGLADQVRMWPTPTAHMAKEGGHPAEGRRNTPTLTFQALWPTPTASSWGNEGSRNLLQKNVEAGEITEAEKRQMSAGNGGKLNPEWVEWLMGFPIGWTDLKD
jgi:hypothetical protein